MRRDSTFTLVLACFFLSGFAGLLFETLWTREFALVFGTSDLAVATVLAAYMGGLALGAGLARRFVLRTARPVLVYGVLELTIGLSALAVPAAVRASRALCVALFGGLDALPDGSGGALTLYTLASAGLVLLIPTVCMGATLPLLTRFAVRSPGEIGSRTGILYATNTAGAVCGVLVTAFVLLPSLGLDEVLWVGVGVNALVFCVAARIGRDPATAAPALEAAAPAPSGRPEGSWVLPLVLLSGVTSFTYEVLWVRLLSHLLGGTVYAFGTMLASFLMGIALGSAAASRLADRRERAQLLFASSQVGVACASLGAFLAVDSMPALAVAWGAGGAGLLANAPLAALVLLPGALFVGASFPLAVRILARDELDASPASARVYAWNTVGAIVGSIGAGFVWIPALGYHGAIAAAAALNLLIALLAAWLGQPRRRAILALATAGLATLLLWRPGPPWILLSTSALEVIAGRERTTNPEDVVYFAAGRSSTVMLTRGAGGNWYLFNNGLPEGGMLRPGFALNDWATQWLVSLATLARSENPSMLMIGLGAGSSLERVAPSIRSIDVIELEQKVVEANRLVADQRAIDPLSDPRVRVSVNDARGALALTDQRWGAIVSQPSHPWTAGASHLFTREFFALSREHLEPGGVLVQWMGQEFMDEALLLSLLATLNDVFGHVQLYFLPHRSAFLFVASTAPIALDENAARALAAHPNGYAHLGVYKSEDVAVMLALDEEGTRTLSAGAPLATDTRNLFQYRAPRILRAPIDDQGVDALVASADPLARPRPGWDHVRLARRVLSTWREPRARRILAGLEQPAEREAVEGMLLLHAGKRPEALPHLRAAVDLDPESKEAWAALTRLTPREGLEVFSPSTRQARGYPELETVARAWARAGRGDWAGLAGLDEALAAVSAADPLYGDALHLRAFWRVEAGDAEDAALAVDLLSTAQLVRRSLDGEILRVRALNRADMQSVALATVQAILDIFGQSGAPNARILEGLGAALAEIPDTPPLAEARARVQETLIARRLELRERGNALPR